MFLFISQNKTCLRRVGTLHIIQNFKNIKILKEDWTHAQIISAITFIKVNFNKGLFLTSFNKRNKLSDKYNTRDI